MNRSTIFNAPLNTIYFLLLSLCYNAKATAPAPVHSPEAYTDLICHTSHASECYPAIFQPTEKFQIVHDDQSIPPGLHVRLNLATGLKEARLNVPEPEDALKADLVIIDNPPPSAKEAQPSLLPAPESTPDSKSRPQTEAQLVNMILLSLEYFVERILDGLTDLPTEQKLKQQLDDSGQWPDPPPQATISHDRTQSLLATFADAAPDREIGLAMMSSPSLVYLPLDILDFSSHFPIAVQSEAIHLLGTALQNNPEALTAFLAHYTTAKAERPITVVHAAIKATSISEITPETILFQKRLIFLLSQICHSPTQLQSFLSASGLSTLLSVFELHQMSPTDANHIISMKIANFLRDHIFSTMLNWEGGSLLRELPSGISISMTEKENVWINAMQGMDQWCHTLSDAIIVLMDPNFVTTEKSTEAYESISAAWNILHRALTAHGRDGGCYWEADDGTFSLGNGEI